MIVIVVIIIVIIKQVASSFKVKHFIKHSNLITNLIFDQLKNVAIIIIATITIIIVIKLAKKHSTNSIKLIKGNFTIMATIIVIITDLMA